MQLNEKLKNLPAKPGCYIFKDKEGKVLYVGKATVLKNRVGSYFQKSRPHDARIQLLIRNIADVEVIVVDSEMEALILENTLIKDRKPRYNIALRDDKSYPYIRITKEDFPQVFVTRKMVRDGSLYFGPYTDVKNLRQTLKTIEQIFPVRSCKYNLSPEVLKRGSVELCLDYYIKKCKGPCQNLFSKEEYGQVIAQIKSLLRGRTEQIFKQLNTEMLQLSQNLEYEEAARVRDKLVALENYSNSQKVVQSDGRDKDIIAVSKDGDDACAVLLRVRAGKILGKQHKYIKNAEWFNAAQLLNSFVNNYYFNTKDFPQDVLIQEEIESQKILEEYIKESSERAVHIYVPQIGEKKKLIEMAQKNARYLMSELKLQKLKNKNYVPHSVTALQRDLRLKKTPRRIECFDISNIQGTDPVASLVCFVDGKPSKKDYRIFNIRIKETPDDFAMMREAIERRYSRLKREEGTMPDLIIVDGGKGQLSSAVEILKRLGLESQSVIGLAKRLEEVFFPGISEAQMLPRTSSSLKLIQQLRNEAHRFAITAHRKRRIKRTLTSELDKVEGIGPTRKAHLLKTFGSVKKMRTLTIKEFVNKGKLPEKVAQNLFDYFTKQNKKQNKRRN